jgi:hypothetical protein
MTQKQLIEVIQQHHPNMGESEIRTSLNRAQDVFTAKTEIIKKTYTQNSVAGTRYYTLDPQVLRIYKVQFNDVNIPRLVGAPLIDDDEFDSQSGLAAASTSSNDRYWYIDNGRVGIVEKVAEAVSRDDKKSDYQSVSVAKEIRLYTISQAVDFTADLAEVSEIPSQYHDALVYKVLSDAYLRAGAAEFNPQASQLFDVKFKETVVDAKKEARNNYMTSGSSIIAPTSF